MHNDLATLEIAPPGRAKSAYFGFLPGAGEEVIWPLIEAVMGAAQQPIVRIGAESGALEVTEAGMTESARQELLEREGYCFGPIQQLDRLPLELDEIGRKTFLFVRDPREILALRRADAPLMATDKLPTLDNLARQYRDCMKFCRARKYVKIVRYEDVAVSWFRLAVDLAGTLDLAIAEKTLFEIAKVASQSILNPPIHTYRHGLDTAARVEIETIFAAEMAYFGYAPEDVLPARFVEYQADFSRAAAMRQSSPNREARPDPDQHSIPIAPQLPKMSVGDPDLRHRPLPNASRVTTVLGRSVAMDVDAAGCRPVIGQNPVGEKTLAAYGCSYTYGTAVPASETFCSILQSKLPAWRVENHGVWAYCQTQNVIQLQRNTRWSAADYVTFCWIPMHHMRNVAEVSWLEWSMRTLPRDTRDWPYPRAGLGPDGSLAIGSTRFPRWDLLDVDLLDFRPDPYYLDLVAAALFRRAQEIVRESGGHFFVTTLTGEFSASLQRMLKDADIPVVDASLSGREYTCLPDDAHPNGRAHTYYAQKIYEYIRGQAVT